MLVWYQSVGETKSALHAKMLAGGAGAQAASQKPKERKTRTARMGVWAGCMFSVCVLLTYNSQGCWCIVFFMGTALLYLFFPLPRTRPSNFVSQFIHHVDTFVFDWTCTYCLLFQCFLLCFNVFGNTNVLGPYIQFSPNDAITHRLVQTIHPIEWTSLVVKKDQLIVNINIFNNIYFSFGIYIQI